MKMIWIANDVVEHAAVASMNRVFNLFFCRPKRVAVLAIAEQFCGHINVINYGKYGRKEIFF